MGRHCAYDSIITIIIIVLSFDVLLIVFELKIILIQMYIHCNQIQASFCIYQFSLQIETGAVLHTIAVADRYRCRSAYQLSQQRDTGAVLHTSCRSRQIQVPFCIQVAIAERYRCLFTYQVQCQKKNRYCWCERYRHRLLYTITLIGRQTQIR